MPPTLHYDEQATEEKEQQAEYPKGFLGQIIDSTNAFL